MKSPFVNQNWFDTLTQALESEDLLDAWECGFMEPIRYGETRQWTWGNGTKYGHFISIYRSDKSGRYERPVHYNR